MKPRELYSGQAPAAMAQMGQGMAEVGSRIADITMRGNEALAKGIGSGLQAIGQAYAQHKEMTADVAAKEKAAQAFLPYLPEDKQEGFKNQLDAVKSDTTLSLRDKKAFYDTAFGMLGNAVGHQMSMEKIGAENAAAMDRAKVGATTAVTTAAMPYTLGQKGDRPFDPTSLLPSDSQQSQPSAPSAGTASPLIPDMSDRILKVKAYQEYNKNPYATGEDYQQFEDNYIKANKRR